MIDMLSMSDLVLGANDRKLLVCKSTRTCPANIDDDRKASVVLSRIKSMSMHPIR